MYNPLSAPSCLWVPDRISGESAWTRHIPFAFALMETLRPSTFVELGTHRGDSYCAFCQSVKGHGLPTACYAVDTWNGDEHSGLYGPEVWDELRGYHDPRYSDFSTLLRMTFDEARRQFPDGTVDLLHIDGCHSYEAAKHDFETWLPAMSSRGIVLLHDILPREWGFGVWQLWEEISQRFEHIALAHTHGLGVVAVGPEKPEAFSLLQESARKSDVALQMFDALGARVDLLINSETTRKRIEEQHSQIVACQAHIEHLNGLVAGLHDEQSRCQQALNEHAQALAMQAQSLAQREHALAEQTQIVADQCTVLADKERLILAKDAQLDSLQQQQAALRQQLDALAAHYGRLRYRLATRAGQWLDKAASAAAPARYLTRVAAGLLNSRKNNAPNIIQRPDSKSNDTINRIDGPRATPLQSPSGQGVLRERTTANDHS